MRLTHHFHLNEFLCRDGTPYPAEWIDSRLRPLCLDLETLRTTLGSRTIYITSGYRTFDYNRAIGGAAASQHVEGRAVDLIVVGMPPGAVQASIRRLFDAASRPFHSITTLGSYPTFTHLDTRVRPTGRWLHFAGKRMTN